MSMANAVVGVVCSVVWLAVTAFLTAELREQRRTIEKLVQKCCDLPEDAPQGTKPRVISPYIDEKTEDEA